MIEPAKLSFTPDGTPYSETYGDVYHASAGGLGQARHVFLAGNGLPQRWQGHERFVILETGFGLGLNFLATWHAWREDAQRGERLHFVSIEKHPFLADDLAVLHAALHAKSPELATLANELRREWPPLVPGLHRLFLEDGRVVLDLVFGDATDWLPQLVAEVDAFYLDGFSPAKNPELWTATLLKALSELAAPDATLATWSVASAVREALSGNGWQLDKAPGYAGKREMLRGTRATSDASATTANAKACRASGAGNDSHAIVLGAGLAGTTAANRLAARGWRITLVDAGEGPGSGASGNRAGVLRPLPSRDDNPLAQITRAGYLATRRHLQALESAGLAEAVGGLWGKTGVLHLARDDTNEAAQRNIVETQRPPADYLSYLDRNAAREHCGWPVAAGGWWFPNGAWVAPAQYCRANLLQHPDAITTRFATQVAAIAHAEGLWRILDEHGACLAEAPHLVIANAADARRLLGDWLPVFPARGQVTHLPAAADSAPRCVVCRLGYVTPAIDGQRYAGATFLMKDPDPSVRDADHAENLQKLEFMLPGFTAGLTPGGLPGRTGFRPASPDRLPIVGAVPRFGDTAAPPGLWLVNGFGARGIVWSALAGELLADSIEGSPQILGADLAAALAPARFLRSGRKAARRPEASE